MTELNIEALAQVLAQESIDDWIMGEMWWGQFDTENEDEMAEALLSHLPYGREQAQRYVDVLLGDDID